MTGKSRVWFMNKRTGRGYMEYPEEGDYLLDQRGKICEVHWGGEIEYYPDATWMFSTGRTVKDTDGNDRELYDGDLVELGYEGDDWPPFQVRFNVEYCGWYLYLREKPWLPLSTNLDKMVIVGNHYEDSELVKA